jgi:hypothetical protein
MILIYTDSEILDLEWIPNIKFPNKIQICHSFEEYRDHSADIKIAFTTQRMHCDHDINCSAYSGFEDKINQLSMYSQLVFTFESELHDFHWDLWKRCHHNNVYWCVPGYVNDNEDMDKHIICWGDWFKTTSMLYKRLPHKISEIHPYTTKPKYFDALLGSPKPHRDFVADAINQNSMENQVIMTYGGKWNDDEFYAKDYFIYEPDTVILEVGPGTANWVEYHGVRTSLSRVIPINVFNDTAYSIVAETDHDNTLSFYSEKTAKPIIAKRLFIPFSGYKFLHNLRRVGFQTFGSIIDESFDYIIDDKTRYNAAFDQVKKLCSMDQQYVYDAVRPVLEHNYELIMNRDWTLWSADQISNLINTTIN